MKINKKFIPKLTSNTASRFDCNESTIAQYNEWNQTINCARFNKRLPCSCTRGPRNGSSEARWCRKLYWNRKPTRCFLRHACLCCACQVSRPITHQSELLKIGFTCTVAQREISRAFDGIAFGSAIDATR